MKKIYIILLYLFIIYLIIPINASAINTKKSRLAELDANDIYWDKSEWAAFCWETIESIEGEYNWSVTDEYVADRQKKGTHIVAEVMPFANWDQNVCHPNALYYPIKEVGLVKKGMICDLEKYQTWLNNVVERYDGDGIDDMPDLKEAIWHWAIGNEPDMKCDENDCYFDVTADQYRQVLFASYNVVKDQNSKIKVLIAGPGTMNKQSRIFYENIFKQNGKNYFDIFTYHAIYPDAKTDTMNIKKMNRFLKKNKINKRPVFAGEWEALANPFKGSRDRLKRNLIQSTAYGLSHGIDKIFYIRGEEFPKSTKKLLVKFFNYAKIEKIYNEDISKNTIKAGKYKFKRLNDKSDFYLVWGKNQALPEALNNIVKITDMHNETTIVNIDDIILSGNPIFIESNY